MRAGYSILFSLKRLLLIGSVAFACFISVQGSASPFKKMIVFGDSLSDSGNLYNLSNHSMPISPPYFQGHFSNGPIWAEYLAQSMQLDPHNKTQFSNYAYAGTWAEDNIPEGSLALVSLSWEINEFLKQESKHGFQNQDELITLWIGANDYLDGRLKDNIEEATNSTVESVRQNLELLIQDGAKNLIILNLPDLGLAPNILAKGTDFASRVSQLVQRHNQKLAAMLVQEQSRHPDINLIAFDLTPYFSDLINQPEKYKLINLTDPCYTGSYSVTDGNNSQNKMQNMICQNPNTYMYWDHVHPTTVIHQLLAHFTHEALLKKLV